MRILLVEDEDGLREVTATRLRQEGFTVDAVDNGTDVKDYMDTVDYDCVVLDIMLPGKNGLDVLRELRARGDGTSVLLLTARDAIDDRVKGLDAGADDYLVKPFHFEELTARIRALLRREPLQLQGNILSAAGLELNLATMKVARNGEEIPLTQREFSLLEVLMRHVDQVLSREQIEHHMYDLDFDGASNVIDVYIRYLRRKIDEGHDEKLIQTVRGVGYALRSPADQA